jgi:hypothetical protein
MVSPGARTAESIQPHPWCKGMPLDKGELRCFGPGPFREFNKTFESLTERRVAGGRRRLAKPSCLEEHRVGVARAVTVPTRAETGCHPALKQGGSDAQLVSRMGSARAPGNKRPFRPGGGSRLSRVPKSLRAPADHLSEQSLLPVESVLAWGPRDAAARGSAEHDSTEYDSTKHDSFGDHSHNSD